MSTERGGEIIARFKCEITGETIDIPKPLNDDPPEEALVCKLTGHEQYGEHLAQLFDILNKSEGENSEWKELN